MKCCICGPVKNCSLYLDIVLKNIEKIGTLFDDYVIILYYDVSEDNTLQKIQDYMQTNPKLKLYINKQTLSPYRTHRIAKGRNQCITIVKNNYKDYDFFIMMDMDDVNCKEVNPTILQKYLLRDDWDALSFNTSPKYYDIWGLSITPYCFSYNHFNNNVAFYTIMQEYITKLLNDVPKNGLLQCISSFNGFAIYKTDKFLNCNYDGRPRLDLLPKHLLYRHMKATNSPIIFTDYGNVNGLYEDCEHRAFHLEAINKNNAKIRISPEVLFT